MTVHLPVNSLVAGNASDPDAGQPNSVAGWAADENDATFVQMGPESENPEEWLWWEQPDSGGPFGHVIAAGLSPGELTFSVRTSRFMSEEFDLQLNPVLFNPVLHDAQSWADHSEGYRHEFNQYPNGNWEDNIVDWATEAVVQHDFTLTLTEAIIARFGQGPYYFTFTTSTVQDYFPDPAPYPPDGMRVHGWQLEGNFVAVIRVVFEPYDLNVDWTDEEFNPGPDGDHFQRAVLDPEEEDTVLGSPDESSSTVLLRSAAYFSPQQGSILTYKLRPIPGSIELPDYGRARSVIWSVEYLGGPFGTTNSPEAFPAIEGVQYGYASNRIDWSGEDGAPEVVVQSITWRLTQFGDTWYYWAFPAPPAPEDLTESWVSWLRVTVEYAEPLPPLTNPYGVPLPFPFEQYPTGYFPVGTYGDIYNPEIEGFGLNPTSLVADAFEYINIGEVHDGTPPIHIWFAYADHNFPNIPFTIYGTGLGEDADTYDTTIYAQGPSAGWSGLGNPPAYLPTPPAPVALVATAWTTQDPTGEAYGADRMIYTGSSSLIGENLDEEDTPVVNVMVDKVTVTVTDVFLSVTNPARRGLRLYAKRDD